MAHNIKADGESGLPSPLTGDLDVGDQKILSSTGDVVIEHGTSNRVTIRREGGVAGNDEVQIYSNGSQGYIRANDGWLRSLASIHEFRNTGDSTTYATINSSGLTVNTNQLTGATDNALRVGSDATSCRQVISNIYASKAVEIDAATTGIYNLNTNRLGDVKQCPQSLLVYASSGTFTSDVTLSFGLSTNTDRYFSATAVFGGTPAINNYEVIDVTTKLGTTGQLAIEITSAATGTDPKIAVIPIMNAITF